MTINYKPGAPAQNYQLATRNNYDLLGRPTIKEKNINNTGLKKISTITYDALGQVKTKKLSPDHNSTGLESLTYDYNIRGWLLGVNRAYARDNNNDHFFGFDLGYDKTDNYLIGGKTHAAAQYNGNISGTVWKSAGDGAIRKYDFSYDAVNRLEGADFKQYTNSSFNIDAGIDFTVSNQSYDANGNIKTMNQHGLMLNTSQLIDEFNYTYLSNSNKLKNVRDNVNNPLSILGDFKTSVNHPMNLEKTGATTQAERDLIIDYDFDANGNLKFDHNKDISSITYNYLNLPSEIIISNKGTITYTYDAAGNKQKKTTVENASAANNNITTTSTTTYIGGIVYESKADNDPETTDYTDVLQFIPHEEGRIRPVRDENNVITDFVYDYMIKDHLGNIRMVLTEEQKEAIYQAGMEDASRSFENELFINIPETVDLKPTGFDTDGNNKNVSQLFSTATDKRIGPGIVLKVMAGDKFTAKVFGWYLPTGTNNSPYTGTTSIVTALIDALSGGIAGAGKGALSELSNPVGVLNSPLTSFTNSPNRPYESNRPKAYLNWILLDDAQLKLVSDCYGAVQVPSITGVMEKQLLESNNGDEITITKNGFLYVYVSNESQGNVYFDDIRVEHIKGPILEETHYYPFGLTMAGISSKAAGTLANKYKFGGKELNNQEFTDGSGLEMYDFGARNYDPQIGRWHNVDPLASAFPHISPYAAFNNNPLRFTDPTGAAPEDWVGKKNENGTTSWSWDDNVTNLEQAKAAGYDDYRGPGSIIDNAKIGGVSGADGKTSVYLGNSAKDVSFTYPNKTVTPFQVGTEWLSGEGPRNRSFTNGDNFTEMLKQHSHVAETKGIILNRIANGGELTGKNPYELDGIQGVGKYVKDYSTLLTAGLTGNLAVTYLGSYTLNWNVTGVDNGSATVLFKVNNASTMQSASRPPIIGYWPIWQQTVGKSINSYFSTGWGSKTSQSFNWTETIPIK